MTFEQFRANAARRIFELQQMEPWRRELEDAQQMVQLLRIEAGTTGRIDGVPGIVPLVRACPKCGVILHFAGGCKYMICPISVCKYYFCFVCLREKSQHSKGEWDFIASCTAAEIQTSIPSLTHRVPCRAN
eukprot:EG_transcript_28441